MGNWQKRFTLTGLPDRVLGVAYSPDSTQLATVGPQYIRVWDARSGQALFSLPSNAPAVCTAAYSPDGTRLATAGFEPPKLWDLASRQALFSLPGHSASVDQVVFSADGSRLATASRDGTARVYTMDLDELVSLAQERLTRGFTPEERRQFLHQEEGPEK